MQLFFQPDIAEGNLEVVFPAEESKHIVKVLRKKTGDILFITNGKGWLFETEITLANPKRCTTEVKCTKKEPEPKFNLHLAVAPTKMNSRYEWFLEKATEIGIAEITPIICNNSERHTIKPARFEKVLQSAMKQSLRTRLPILHPAISFSDFMKKALPGEKFIAYCEDEKQKQLLSRQQLQKKNITILIGPEGDFSSEEIKTALESHWLPVSLGNHRLRTETAAIVACTTVVLANESEDLI